MLVCMYVVVAVFDCVIICIYFCCCCYYLQRSFPYKLQRLFGQNKFGTRCPGKGKKMHTLLIPDTTRHKLNAHNTRIHISRALSYAHMCRLL